MKQKIILSLTTALLVAATFGWVFKDKLYPRTHGPNSVIILKIPDSIRKDIDRAVVTNHDIVGIQIMTIHFQRNIRIDTLMSISNSAVQEIYDRFVNSRIIETPFFTSDAKNNKRMLQLINGEFVCVPYKESIAYSLVPSAANYVSTVCAIGIPPHNHGEFTGISTFYLAVPPTGERMETLFLFARELSVKIYDANNTQNVYTNQP